jgi:hypothetical protein
MTSTVLVMSQETSPLLGGGGASCANTNAGNINNAAAPRLRMRLPPFVLFRSSICM